MNVEEATIFTDKSEMRRRAHASGIASPLHREVTLGDDPLTFLRDAEQLGWPVVAKPRRGTGGRGIEVLRSLAETEAWSRKRLRDGDVTGWLIEEFVEGDLFHVDGLTAEGKVLHVWPSKYNIGALQALKTNSAHTSYLLGADDPRKAVLVDFARSLFRAFPHLQDLSAFHLEVFLCSGRPILCEVACRPAGGGVDVTHMNAFDISIAREHLRGQLGLSYTSLSPAKPRIYAGWALLPALGERLVFRGKPPSTLGIIKAGLPQPGLVATSREVADAPGLVVLTGSSPESVKNRLEIVEEWWQDDSVWD